MNIFITKDFASILFHKRFLKWATIFRHQVIPEYHSKVWSPTDLSPGWRIGRKMKFNWRQFDLYSLKHQLNMFCIYNIYYGCYCTVLPNRFFYTSGHIRNTL